ncbi:unnamed protein product, partial [Prunus brigantina]
PHTSDLLSKDNHTLLVQYSSIAHEVNKVVQILTFGIYNQSHQLFPGEAESLQNTSDQGTWAGSKVYNLPICTQIRLESRPRNAC